MCNLYIDGIVARKMTSMVLHLSFHVPQLAAIPLQALPVSVYVLCGRLTSLHPGSIN